MWRLAVGLGGLVGVASCAPAELPIPDGAGRGDRFLAVEPAALPACGAAGSMPVRGRLPALGGFREREGVVLLELDGAPISAHYGDDEPVPVQRITERGFEDRLDTVALEPAIKAW